MEGQQFCLRWHNFQNTLLSSLPKLLDGGHLTDVTLSAGGRNIQAHRIILSACSYYFKELFKVFMNMCMLGFFLCKMADRIIILLYTASKFNYSEYQFRILSLQCIKMKLFLLASLVSKIGCHVL